MDKNIFLKSLAKYLHVDIKETRAGAGSFDFEEFLSLAFENMVFKNLDEEKADKLIELLEKSDDKKVWQFLDLNISDWQMKLQKIILKNVN